MRWMLGTLGTVLNTIIGLPGVLDDIKTWRERWLPMLGQYLPDTSALVSWGILGIGTLMLLYAVHPPLLRRLLPWHWHDEKKQEAVLQKMRALKQLIKDLNPDNFDQEELVRMTELGESLMRFGFGPEKCRQTGNFDSQEWYKYLTYGIPYVEQRGVRGALKKFREDHKKDRKGRKQIRQGRARR